MIMGPREIKRKNPKQPTGKAKRTLNPEQRACGSVSLGVEFIFMSDLETEARSSGRIHCLVCFREQRETKLSSVRSGEYTGTEQKCHLPLPGCGRRSQRINSGYLGTDDLEERAKVACKLEYSGWTACYWSSWERLKKNTVRATTGQELSPSLAPKQRQTGDLHGQFLATPKHATLLLSKTKPTTKNLFKRKRKPKEVSCVKCSHHRPVQDGGAESLLWGQTCPSKCLLRPCKWFSGEGQCPLENLFSGSPTTAVQPRTGEVAWWPEMAEGEVQLTAVGGLVLFCNLRKCYILSCHSQVKGRQKALPMLKKGVHCQNRRKRV